MGTKHIADREIGNLYDVVGRLRQTGKLSKLFVDETDFESNSFWRLIELLYQDHAEIVKPRLRDLLKLEDVEIEKKIIAARYLANLGEFDGFEFLIEYIKLTKSSINGHVRIHNVNTEKALNLLAEFGHHILDRRNEEGFRDSLSGLLIDWLKDFASKSEEDTLKVFEFYSGQIEKLKDSHDNINDLYWYAFRVIEDYRKAEISLKSVPEVRNILTELG